jgi:hypothetical protein
MSGREQAASHCAVLVSSDYSRPPRDDDARYKNSHDRDVIDDVEHGPRTDADHDREDADECAEEREALSSKTRGTSQHWPKPRDRSTGKQHDSDHRLGDLCLSVLVALKPKTRMD